MIWDCTCTTEVFFFYQQRINFKLRGYKRGIQPFTQPKLYFLLTLRDHHYIFKTTMMHNFGDPRLHTHGYRLFTDGDHVGHGDDAYLRRPPTTQCFIDWRSYWPSTCPHPHRPSLPMTFCSSRTTMMHNFRDHRLRTNGDRRFIVRRQPTTYTRRSPLYRLTIILVFRSTTDYVRTEIAA